MQRGTQQPFLSSTRKPSSFSLSPRAELDDGAMSGLGLRGEHSGVTDRTAGAWATRSLLEHQIHSAVMRGKVLFI